MRQLAKEDIFFSARITKEAGKQYKKKIETLLHNMSLRGEEHCVLQRNYEKGG